jgi:hypothetical protein
MVVNEKLNNMLFSYNARGILKIKKKLVDRGKVMQNSVIRGMKAIWGNVPGACGEGNPATPGPTVLLFAFSSAGTGKPVSFDGGREMCSVLSSDRVFACPRWGKAAREGRKGAVFTACKLLFCRVNSICIFKYKHSPLVSGG